MTYFLPLGWFIGTSEELSRFASRTKEENPEEKEFLLEDPKITNIASPSPVVGFSMEMYLEGQREKGEIMMYEPPYRNTLWH